jgi:hypothetical protein
LSSLLSKVAAAAAAALLLAAPPALADVAAAPAEQLLASAKPMQAQSVNKGRVWLLFAMGASTLYGTAVLLENNAAWFPAIARANKALQAGLAAAEARELQAVEEELEAEERLEAVLEERTQDARAQGAVLAGLQAAKERALPAAADAAAAADEASSSSGSDEEEAGPPAQRDGRTPLFEISGEQIEASSQQAQRAALQGVSLEQLEREVEERRAEALGKSGERDAA